MKESFFNCKGHNWRYLYFIFSGYIFGVIFGCVLYE